MAADKDGDGCKVPTKTGEVIPDILLDQNDNDATVGSKGASTQGGNYTQKIGVPRVLQRV